MRDIENYLWSILEICFFRTGQNVSEKAMAIVGKA